MAEQRPRVKTLEFTIFCASFLVSLCLLVLNAFLKTRWQQKAVWWSVLGDVSSAILTASLIGIGQIVLRFYIYKKKQEQFESFWGQKYGSPSGRVVLQSDLLHTMTDQLTHDLCDRLAKKLNNTLPIGFDTSLKDLLESEDTASDQKGNYKYGKNRLFKARNWLNRCDVEGARNIREAFTVLGFDPPNFETCERKRDMPSDLNPPFEIYMGLGFTQGIQTHVNESCRGFLSIQATDKGDAICLRDSLAGNAIDTLSHTAFSGDASESEEEKYDRSILYPKGWNVHDYAGEIELNDYAYILRDMRILERPRLGETQVVFHVAGFTEQGTWAAGHYLRHRWQDLNKKYVQKGVKYGGRFVILLRGTSPFREPKDGTNLWEEVEVIAHDNTSHRRLNRNWDTELEKLISEHKNRPPNA